VKARLFLCAIFLSAQNMMYACGGLTTPVYAGKISYAVNPSNPMMCTVEASLEFDIPQFGPTDSIMINWGDGTEGPIFATSTFADDLANAIYDHGSFYRHVFSGSHIYGSVPAGGFYFISVMNQFRLNDIVNISVGNIPFLPYYIEAQVRIDSVSGILNESPVLPVPAIEYAYPNSPYHLSTFLNDPEGDSVVFDLVTPMETHDSVVPDYYSPDFYCGEFGFNNTFQINRATGEISWTVPCAQGIFNVATIARKYRNGRLLGSVMSDQNIWVTTDAPNAIRNYSVDRSFRLYPNPANSFIQVQTEKPLSLLISNVFGETVRILDVKSSALVDISDLSKGVYILRDLKNSSAARFVKE
jgi:hypothetical protein